MTRDRAGAVLELLKPITWFAPMWAFMCGVVSAGLPLSDRWLVALGGALLAGPLVCGTSQAANDWFDRHVDAINEPDRPIPSGRIPGRWGLWIAILWTLLSLAVASLLGRWVLVAAVIGLLLAWAYSAPPIRLKQSGWWGPAAVAICYEGLPWFTGAAIMVAALPDARILMLAAFYSLGAHGIMTLNDFKAVAGDRAMGIQSLPARMGTGRAVRLASAVMALPQVVVIGLLLSWDLPLYAAVVVLLLGGQMILMIRLMRDPEAYAPWYNATGTTLYVLGMLACAIGLAGRASGAGS